MKKKKIKNEVLFYLGLKVRQQELNLKYAILRDLANSTQPQVQFDNILFTDVFPRWIKKQVLSLKGNDLINKRTFYLIIFSHLKKNK